MLVFVLVLSAPNVHQIWVGPNPVPKLKQHYMGTVKNMALMHGALYRLWDMNDLNAKNFPRLWGAITNCLQHRRPWSMVADLMMYEILYNHGGLYVDANFEILQPQPIRAVLTSNKTILSYENKNVLSAGFIYSRQRSTFLACCVRKILKKPHRLRAPANKATGPGIVNRCASPFDKKLSCEKVYPYTPWTGRGGTDKCLQSFPGAGFTHIGHRYALNTPMCAAQYNKSWAVDHFDNDGHSWK